MARTLLAIISAESAAVDRRTGFHGVVRGGLANLAGAVVSALASLVLVVIVTRFMPQSEAGAVFATTSLFLLAEAGARLGADLSIVHFLAGARGSKRQHDVGALLRAALIPVIAVGALTGVVLILAAPALLNLVHGAPVQHGRALVAVLGIAVPIAAGYDVVVAATRGLGAVSPTVLIERLLRPALQVVLVLLAVVAGGQTLLVVFAWAVPYVIAAVPASLALRRLWRSASNTLPLPERSQLGEFWRFTLPRSLSAVVQMAIQRLDILLVAAMLGVAAAAVYTAATRIVVVGQLGNQAVWYAVQPRLATLVAAAKLGEARLLYRLSTAWIMALNWPLFIAGIVAAPVVLRIFGSGYEQGADVMVVLGLAMLVATGCGLVDIVLITLGKTTWNLANTLLVFAINVGVDLALIPRLGIVGAAIGWALAIVVGNLVALAQVSRVSGFHPFSRLSANVAIHALVCFAAAPALAIAVFGEQPSSLGAGLAVGGLVYAAGMWRLRTRLQLDIFSAAPPAAVMTRTA